MYLIQQCIMTPLGASLAFVLISVIVSLIRQFFFHSSALNANDDSNISLLKLHTLTIHQSAPQKRSYNSLYEAYFKPALPNQVQSNLPYNSYALKRTVLNNEGVYLCDEYFAAIFQERTVCEKSQGDCRWKTIITVYRLPFLKREFSKLLQVDGKILRNDNKHELTCTVKQDSLRLRYQINFAVQINEKESKKYPGWSMNSLIIEEEGRIWEKGEGPFSLKLVKVNLKNVNHYPLLYSFDERCLSYVTQEEPWLVHYNCADSWNQVNVLRAQIQSKLFNANNPLFPTFSTAHQVRPLFMELFLSTFKTFADSIPRQQPTYSKHFITYVFEITNSPFRFGKVIAQVTLALNTQTSNRKLELVSYKVLMKNEHPDKNVYVDCSLSSKEHRLIRGMYTYQLGFGDDNVVASLQRHSLMCIFAYNYHDMMKVIEIDDILRNFNISDFPPEISLKSRQFLQQKKMENNIFKRQNTFRKRQQQQQDNTWLDFDFFSFDYQDEDSSENETLSTEESYQQLQKEQKSESESQKKQRKVKSKGRREEKRRSTMKKNKKEGRKEGDIKTEKDDQLRERLQDLAQIFSDKGGSAIESEGKSIIVSIPFVLTGESKFKIINGDPEFPLIYVEAVKKYLLAYHLKDDSDNPEEGNLTSPYAYKYLQIGVDLKSPESYLTLPDYNMTSVKKRDFLETDLDKFLLQVIDYNEEIMNSVKAISVVDAKYGDQGVREYKLKGLLKPYRKQVIVAWGWGLQVYEVNWDKKGVKTQLLQIEEQLNGQQEGIEMALLLPFVELFATVYCLLQSLITSR